jgi:hypothetical protein
MEKSAKEIEAHGFLEAWAFNSLRSPGVAAIF